MKKILLIAAVAALTACSQATEKPAEAAAEESPEPQETAAGQLDPFGTFDLKRYNGGTSILAIRADGTYNDVSSEGATIGSGKFALKDGKYCFKPADEETEECWTWTRNEDGSITAVEPNSGHKVTLTRQANETTPAAAETITK